MCDLSTRILNWPPCRMCIIYSSSHSRNISHPEVEHRISWPPRPWLSSSARLQLKYVHKHAPTSTVEDVIKSNFVPRRPVAVYSAARLCARNSTRSPTALIVRYGAATYTMVQVVETGIMYGEERQITPTLVAWRLGGEGLKVPILDLRYTDRPSRPFESVAARPWLWLRGKHRVQSFPFLSHARRRCEMMSNCRR